MSGDRRRHTKVVWGSRNEAEAELALLRIQLTAGKLPSGTRARDVAAACESYLGQVSTEGDPSVPPCHKPLNRTPVVGG